GWWTRPPWARGSCGARARAGRWHPSLVVRPLGGLCGPLVVVVLVLVDRYLELAAVDRVALLVEQLDPLQEELQRLALPDVGAYRRELADALELGPDLVRGLAHPLGHALDLGVEVLVGALDALGVGHGPQG